MNFNDILNFVCILAIAYMVIRIFQLQKRNRKNKKLINMVNQFQDQTVFFPGIQEIIDGDNDLEFQTKARVLQLWGSVYYDKDDLFEKCLKEIHVDTLIGDPSKKGTLDMNEDSLFYLFLAIPNRLYYRKKSEQLEELYNQIEIDKEELKQMLVVEIGKKCRLFYEKKDDQGKAFFENVLEGEYGGFRYSKQLIAIYKEIVVSVLAKIYQQEGNQEGFDTLVPDMQSFAKRKLGERFLEELEIKLPEVVEDAEQIEDQPEEPKEEKQDSEK